VLANVVIWSKLGGALLSRWAHFLSGITWIGLLYYFNFVQVPSFAQFEAGPRTEATRKLVPRALWWFRYGALFTVLSGLLILGFQQQYKSTYFKSAPGTSILSGIIFGLTMFANVWLVIWPNQKIAIASAERVAAGGEPDPAAAAAARRGFLASRTNTWFSIPLLFFMAATSHFAGFYHTTNGRLVTYWIIFAVIWALIEANALGLLGGTGPSPLRKPLESVKNVIISGFVLWFVLLVMWEAIFKV
jgi:uncharacterized membrane protein